MEESDGDLGDFRGNKEMHHPPTAAALGLSKSRSNGKLYQELGGHEKPVIKQQQSPPAVEQAQQHHPRKVENYPVYQPSPEVADPVFEASNMTNDSSTNKRGNRKCLWLLILCIVLIVVVVVPVAVVLNKNSQDNSNVSTASQNADKGNDVSQGSDGTTDSNSNEGASDGSTDNDGSTNTNGGGESSTGSGTSKPTATPVQDSPLLRVIQSVASPEQLADATTPQAKAAQWLQDSEGSYDYQGSDVNRLQRYALSVLGFAMFPTGVDVPLFGNALDNECEWNGVICGEVSNASLIGASYWSFDANTTNISSGVVTELVWAEKNLTGSIPSEIALLSSLDYLDFGENALTGSLPDELFSLSDLQRLYVHQNQLQGTLPETFSQLGRLVSFYGGNNQFSGSIPQGLGSISTGGAYVRPLRK